MAGKIRNIIADKERLNPRLDFVISEQGGQTADFWQAEISAVRDLAFSTRKLWFFLAFLTVALVCLMIYKLSQGIISLDLIWFTALYLLMLSGIWYLLSTKIQNKIDEKVVAVVTELLPRFLARTVTIKSPEENSDYVLYALSKSKLFTDSYSKITIDETFILEEPYHTEISEVEITSRTDKGVEVINFHGLLVLVRLEKSLAGHTFISTKRDKSGFADLGLFSSLFSPLKLKKDTLEWNGFNQDFNIYTNDSTEARVVFTPDFMAAFHDWWSEEREAVRVAFHGNHIALLLPNADVKLFRTVPAYNFIFFKPEVIKKYFLTIVTPLWRVATLLDEVRLR